MPNKENAETFTRSGNVQRKGENLYKRPPWYGGNKIPESYLKKFLPPIPKDEEGMSEDLRSFLTRLGVSDPVPTSVDLDD